MGMMGEKKYYEVEFNIVEGVWAESKDEAFKTARRRLESTDNCLDLIWNYDDCVNESDAPDWTDPDAPDVEER